MIAVIFEVWPREGRKEEYLDIAAKLRPLLAEIDGFVSIERFQSLTEPGKVLSLSFWKDEAAVATPNTRLRFSWGTLRPKAAITIEKDEAAMPTPVRTPADKVRRPALGEIVINTRPSA